MLKRRLTLIVLLAVIVSGCAAGRAYRRGQEAARGGDWDAAVAHFTRAVQENPDRPEYKIALERAMQSAAQEHISKARDLEQKDQPDLALIEYRRALEMDPSNRSAASRAAALEKTIRERIEAARPRPQMDRLREQARAMTPPAINLTTRLPRVRFNNSSVRDILNFIGSSAGISINYDAQYQDKAYSIDVEDVTAEEALQQIMQANQLFYKVLNPKTILIIPDTPQKHAQYDDLVVRVFYISHADVTELNQLINTIMRVPQMAVPPTVMPNKTASTITVRATAPVVDVIERIIRANDKPRAEVIIDVQILEVNRARARQFGLNLSAYAVGIAFSPETAPGNTNAAPTFNLNTISQGISTADFYASVPTALVRFLESDSHTKTIAKPQLRGAEGTKLTLNLGDDIPVLSTVFGSAAAGGFATIPQSSFNYRSVGVNLEMTPRVTYDGEVVLELVVENSTLGGSIDVAGQSVPTFGTRKVTTKLRLREGESNLLAGLLRERDRKDLRGFPGLLRMPVFKQFLSDNDQQIEQTDIVMLLTPHIVRTHELTAEDLAPIYIGTQSNVGLAGPPPLIAPPGEEPPASPVGPTTPNTITPSTPGMTTPGVPRSPVASEPGAQPVNRPAPPGTTAAPTAVAPLPERTPTGAPVTPATPTAGVPPGTNPTTSGTPVGGATPPPRDPTATPPAVPGTVPPPAVTPAQVILTPPGPEFRIGGGPYTSPISVNNASRVSVVTLTVTFNPNVLRVRTAQDGTFMRQGGVPATFTPKIDAAAGRVDIAITRTGDVAGASGTGLLGSLLFDAVGPGTSTIQISGSAATPEGTPIPLSFSPVTVTVR